MVDVLGALLFAIMGAVAPTKGDVWRLIHTDPNAFAEADQNRDGRISDYEFDRFYADRGGYDRKPRSLAAGPVADTNRDGAFTPDELYPEAHKLTPEHDPHRPHSRTNYGEPYYD